MSRLFNHGVMAVCLMLGLTLAYSPPAWAKAGSNAITQARVAEGGIARCEASRSGQALIDCVADVMEKLATAVDRGEVPAKAPRIISLAREAAQVRGKPKAQALGILRRVTSVIRGLASKGGDFGPAYSAVGKAFARAVTAIERKG